MKYLLSGLVLASIILPFTFGGTLADRHNNIETAAINKGDIVDKEHGVINFLTADDDSDFQNDFKCKKGGAKQLTFTGDEKFAACCLPGQKFCGSNSTAFDCCAEGHDLAGSKEKGYHCCPTGQIYNGSMCIPHDLVCQNGKTLVNGKCVCPQGTVDTADGTCKKMTDYDSGITIGKCYTFKMQNGFLLGYDTVNWYNAGPETSVHKFGMFSFCKDEKCKAGLSVNPGDRIQIFDHHNAGTAGNWLDGAKDGIHINRTPDYGKAGNFSITKWTCGKYCLGGLDYGIREACPSNTPSLTFNTQDKQQCLPVEIAQIPCDIHSAENNCLWEKTPGACGPGDSNHCQCPPLEEGFYLSQLCDG